MFRKLRADEIECRIQSVKSNGLVLLLYKDARCDMRILDETVGAGNWQRHHEVINGNLFCNVGVRFVKDESREFAEWVWKQDVGTESNTEAEKGQASDSFKRACFNWGIGRELYTAPFTWIGSSDCKINNGKCYDKFKVNSIGYDEQGNINELTIFNEALNRVVFKMGKKVAPKDYPVEYASDLEKKNFMDLCKLLDVDWKEIRKQAGHKHTDKMTVEEHGKCLIILKKIEEANEKN